MYTDIKVRHHLESYGKDPGRYEATACTREETASADAMQRDFGFIPGTAPAKG